MGNPIEEYINNLEGKSDLNPQQIVQDLLGLHNTEISTREAKISELKDTVAQRDSAITEKDGEIQKWKAQNFDLATQVAGGNVKKPQIDENGKPSGDAIRVSDLFNKTVRGRHFNGN